MPPVPYKLVTRIQAGKFIDIAELLPDHLGSRLSVPPLTPQSQEDKPAPKPKRRQMTNILEWVQCFNIYLAVILVKSPSRIRDLLGYQTLIFQASMEYKGDGWLGYDCRFCLNAAADPDMVWARLDPPSGTLLSLAEEAMPAALTASA